MTVDVRLAEGSYGCAARRRRAGQAMIEYVIVAAALLALVTVSGFWLYALRQNADRVLDLVASDYP